MTQIVPLVATLGPLNTGLTIGYRVLNLDRTTYSVFTVTGVSESTVLGTYFASGGVTVPTAGAYVVVGTSGTDMAELPVGPLQSPVGAGLLTYTDTVMDTLSNPVDGARVWLTTDEAGSSVVGESYTNSFGVFAIAGLDPGVYWRWVQMAGYSVPKAQVTVA